MTALAVFDCDGTLVDSQANICLAMEHAFAHAGQVVPPRRDIRRIVGLSLVEAVAALVPDLPPALQAAIAEGYRTAFQRLRGRGLVDEPLFPGIVDALDALAAAGWALGVATGKSDRGLRHCLERHGIADRFVTLQTADRHPSKPHPAMVELAMVEAGATPAQTVMIGDTRFDIGMARAAGVLAVGVAWGYHGADELRGEGADFVAETPAELVPLLEGWRQGGR